MRVLLDVNVFEDIFRRNPDWQSSLRVLTLVRKGRIIDGASG